MKKPGKKRRKKPLEDGDKQSATQRITEYRNSSMKLKSTHSNSKLKECSGSGKGYETDEQVNDGKMLTNKYIVKGFSNQ